MIDLVGDHALERRVAAILAEKATVIAESIDEVA